MRQGYGRGELHPHSDIDVLLLSLDTITNTLNKQISDFIALLWDIGLQPAVVARSLADCEIACQDITVATSLLETRLLAGDDKFIGLPLQILQKLVKCPFLSGKSGRNQSPLLKI